MSVIATLMMLASTAGQTGQWGGKGNQLRHYAACLVATDGHDAQELVRSPIGSKEQSRFGQKLANDHPGCLQRHGITLIHGDVVRGMISEIYLKKHPELLEEIALKPASAPIRLSNGLDERVFLNEYSQCLFTSSPYRTVAVLRTEAASDEERTTILAFGELLKACVPNDIAYHINFEELRVHLASTVYYAATSSASSSSKR